MQTVFGLGPARLRKGCGSGIDSNDLQNKVVCLSVLNFVVFFKTRKQDTVV